MRSVDYAETCALSWATARTKGPIGWLRNRFQRIVSEVLAQSPADRYSDAGWCAVHNPNLASTSSLPDPPKGEGYLRLWRSESLPGVELLVGVNNGRHCRLLTQGYTFCVIPQSENPDTDLTMFRYRRQVYTYRPRTVGMEEPGEIHHNIRVLARTSFWLLQIDPAQFEAAAAEMGLPSAHFRQVLTSQPEVYDALTRLYRSLTPEATPLEQQSQLAECLRVIATECLERRREPRNGNHPGIERSREYLHAHATEPVQLDELARVAGLSRFHLTRVFTKTFGISPHAYQNQLRLHEAKRQLRAGRSLSEVECGFFDLSHLTRHFRNAWTLTPGHYATPPEAALPPLD